MLRRVACNSNKILITPSLIYYYKLSPYIFPQNYNTRQYFTTYITHKYQIKAS